MSFIHVIIPCYNVEKYLEQAVYSVLNQPCKEIDIVLVDDGSPGSTPLLCDEIAAKEERVHVIHKPNGGVSSARNTGIDHVLQRHADSLSGQYIAFLDADDTWQECFLDTEVTEKLSDAFDLAGYQSCVCNEKLTRKNLPNRIQQEGSLCGGADHVWAHSSQSFASMFYSCKFLQNYNIRFTEGLKYSEDKIFSLQCMYLADRIWLENHVMYLYRTVASSAMASRKFGIPYYQPIIDAYLEMDQAMERWANPIRRRLVAGRICASRYIVYMMEEHFQNWRSKKTLDRCFKAHPEYIAIMKCQPPYEFIPRNMRYEEYENSPCKFILKNNLLGIGKYIRRKLAMVVKHFY